MAEESRPLAVNVPRTDEPSPAQVERAATLLRSARNPIVLAGHGAARAGAGEALRRFAEAVGVPVATTSHGKGVFPDDHPSPSARSGSCGTITSTSASTRRT